jgi:malonyl-CoA/methylmalonyl-CoA synthetase
VLIPPFLDPPDKEAVRFEDRCLTYEQLLGAVSGMADRVRGAERVAVWASPTIDTCIGILSVLAASAAAVPINPRLGALADAGRLVLYGRARGAGRRAR